MSLARLEKEAEQAVKAEEKAQAEYEKKYVYGDWKSQGYAGKQGTLAYNDSGHEVDRAMFAAGAKLNDLKKIAADAAERAAKKAQEEYDDKYVHGDWKSQGYAGKQGTLAYNDSGHEVDRAMFAAGQKIIYLRGMAAKARAKLDLSKSQSRSGMRSRSRGGIRKNRRSSKRRSIRY